MSDEDLKDTMYMEGKVSASDGRPFVTVTCGVGDRPVWATNMSPSSAVATGLRLIQASIEAERDAGMVAFLRAGKAGDREIGAMLVGIRTHREQFDAEAGSMRSLGGDDPSELSDDAPEEPS